MPPVYLLAAIDIDDRETYALYERAAGKVLQTTAALPLVIDDNPTVLEGTLPGRRIVMMRFESEQALTEWYQGQPYQDAMKIRQRSAATPFLLMAKGWEPPIKS